MDTQRVYIDHLYSYPQQQIKVDAQITLNRELTKDESYEISMKLDEISKLLRNNTMLNSTSLQNQRELEKEQLLDCFGQCEIFSEPISNEYRLKDDLLAHPWFMVTTDKGRIKIGWRKNVIVIDWSKSVILTKSDDLFADENVTKDEQMIHADGYEKATAYLNKILA